MGTTQGNENVDEYQALCRQQVKGRRQMAVMTRQGHENNTGQWGTRWASRTQAKDNKTTTMMRRTRTTMMKMGDDVNARDGNGNNGNRPNGPTTTTTHETEHQWWWGENHGKGQLSQAVGPLTGTNHMSIYITCLNHNHVCRKFVLPIAWWPPPKYIHCSWLSLIVWICKQTWCPPLSLLAMPKIKCQWCAFQGKQAEFPQKPNL